MVGPCMNSTMTMESCGKKHHQVIVFVCALFILLFGLFTQTALTTSQFYRQTDDADACNRVREDPLYYYVSNQWYPYVPGCQGPTNMIHEDTLPFYATCSLNIIEQFQTPLKGLGEDCVANQHWCEHWSLIRIRRRH